jgi:hypothetical protein
VKELVAGRDTVRSVRRRARSVVALGLVVALVACGGNDGPPRATPTPDASATAAALAISSGSSVPATATMAPEYGEVVWTTAVDPRSKEPLERVEAFVTDAPTIYAALTVRNVPPSTVLTADWTYNDTSLDGLTTRAVVAAGSRDDWVEFHLTRSADPWPDGTYEIDISVDGSVIQRAKVEVEKR